MDDIREKVSKLTLKLQSQTDLPLWALANEMVIYSVAVSEKPAWGPRARILLHIMKVAYKINATDFLIFCVGLHRALLIWWRVKKNTFSIQKSTKFQRIFAGFGASSEEYLYADYIRQSRTPHLRINHVTHEGLAELGCPSFTSIFFTLARNSFGHTDKLQSAIDEISSNVLDFLMVCALNIGGYAFYRAYWRRVKSLAIEEVAFLVLDVQAFSCVDEGIKTVYLQHGLMALSILIPKLSRIEVLTFEEECYLKKSLNEVQIVRTNRELRDNSPKNNLLMVLSLNISIEERLITVEPLIQWAIELGLQLVIRPTINVAKDELDILHKRFPGVVLDDFTVPVFMSYKRWYPKFVVAWTSTGLATALEHGCLPISLCDPVEKNALWNMIYPMRNRVLFWPRDKDLLEMAAQSENVFHSQWINLCGYKDLCLASPE